MKLTIEYFKKHLLAVLIGVLGFLSAVVTLFVDINQLISIKWLLFLVFLSLIIISILFGLSMELMRNNEKIYNFNQLKLIDLNKNAGKGEVFLNKSNVNFNYGDVVKVYYFDKDKVERFIGIGLIEHIQKEQKICHIRFLLKNKNESKSREVYFSLQINRDELSQLMEIE